MPAILHSLVGALVLAAAAAPVADDLMPAFPEGTDRTVIVNWLTDVAGVPRGAPLDLAPESAVVVLTDSTVELREGLHTVTFREDGIGTGFVARTGGRSISGSATVDCGNRQAKSGALTVFHGSGLKGERVNVFPAQETWRAPPPASLLARVVDSVCVAAAPAPAPSGETPTPAPAPAPVEAATGNVAVQVGAFVKRDQALTALTRATDAAEGELTGRFPHVSTATVNGAQVHRALIDGFPTRNDAQAFCARLQEKTIECLVRP